MTGAPELTRAAGLPQATPPRWHCWWQAEKGGVSRQELLRSHPVLRSEPFDSETRRMSVTVTQGAGTCTYWKGAADAILPLCGFQMRDGKTVPFSESDRAAVRRSVTELSDQALRVLAFAGRRTAPASFWGLPECWIRPENPPGLPSAPAPEPTSARS